MSERLLIFRHKNDLLGIPANLPQAVIELSRVAPLPGGTGGLGGLVVAQGRAVPLLDLHRLAGLPRHPEAPLGLLVNIGDEVLVFPMDEVVGNIVTEDNHNTADSVSLPQDLPGAMQPVRIVNPSMLLHTLQSRLMPV